MERQCTYCDAVERETYDKLDTHAFGEWNTVVAATTTSEGSAERVCKDCGTKETKVLEKLPDSGSGDSAKEHKHDFGDWVVTKEATFDTAGSKERVCRGCDLKETEGIPILVLKTGTRISDASSGGVYQIQGDQQSVTYKGPSNKEIASAVIPDMISYGGKVFKVTAIADRAFAGCSNLMGVTIGKNVTTIGKQAFGNCPILIRLYVKTTKLKKVGAKALKATDPDLVVKVPKKRLKKYKKLFRKKGQAKTARIMK